jgi:NAD+ kinase
VLRVSTAAGEDFAINEAALLKDPAVNVIQISAAVDGQPAGRFHADGAIVATPTGSTAYAASAGGALLDPRTAAAIFVVINPHTLAARSLVVPADSRLSVSVDEPARLILDGEVNVGVGAGEPVTCSLDGPPLRLIRGPGAPGFYHQLRGKLGWGEPLVRDGRKAREG